ncbi:putative Linear gramicidin synthase subunit C [Streptomyces afghaniensis 772]|uniref:Putative Linear gramicidin synthase subunit C n=1 Tax=Streptomyces afghaniensis 772 TaxID=1283301 RepID=S4MQU3_9ACTN|nr:putative Linear gramicidin synthase subunit C [Streptomyces afghaniensis 772]
MREAVVIVRDERLVAYLVIDSELPSTTELRQFVAGALPEYMVPAAFVELERIPLTVNGKLDRRALPEPDASVETGHTFVAPRTPTGERVAEVWQEVLGVERVGVEDGFFELGGDSIPCRRPGRRAASGRVRRGRTGRLRTPHGRRPDRADHGTSRGHGRRPAGRAVRPDRR